MSPQPLAVNPPPAIPLDCSSSVHWLDEMEHSLLHAPHSDLVPQIVDYFAEARKLTAPERWREKCVEFREHSLVDLLHQDPFSQRAFRKPFGYAGDAGIIDLIYRHPSVRDLVESSTELGRLIYETNLQQPAPRAVRLRRARIARAIDQIDAGSSAQICALGCGYLRELEESERARGGRLGPSLALDQDSRCIESLQGHYSEFPIRFLQDGVKMMLAPPAKFHQQFHLVYAAGLFDYLSDRMGARLLAGMLTMTRPGGKVLIANFLPGIVGRAYMEAVMDWWLIYRDTEQMLRLADACPTDRLAEVRVFRDELDCVVYLELTAA